MQRKGHLPFPDAEERPPCRSGRTVRANCRSGCRGRAICRFRNAAEGVPYSNWPPRNKTPGLATPWPKLPLIDEERTADQVAARGVVAVRCQVRRQLTSLEAALEDIGIKEAMPLIDDRL